MNQETALSQGTQRRLLRPLVTGVLLLNLLVAGIVWFSLQNSKTHHEEQAAVTTRNISRVLDENISGIFEKSDLALQAVSDEAERQLADGGIQPKVLDSFIIRQHARLPELLSFRATNAAGDALYGPAAAIATTTSLAHRDYFKLLSDNPNAGMVISKPLIGGISGKWMVILARRINLPDGTFGGLVYAGLGLEYVTQGFEDLNVGAGGSITLVTDDLSLVARYPAPQFSGVAIGQKIDSPQLLARLNAGSSSAPFEAKGRVDGVEQIASYRPLSFSPQFHIITGLAITDYLAGWQAEVFKMSLLFAAYCVSTIVSAWLVSRGWQKTWRAEQAVIKSEQRFRLFVENANDFIYTLSAEGSITYIAPNVEYLLGYLPEALMGTSFARLVHPEELSSCAALLEQTVASGMQQSGLEYRIRHHNGHWRWFLVNASLVQDAATGERMFLGIGRDITDRKLAEEALQEANDALEARVRERTRSAENANKVLHAVIECMSDWVWEVNADGRFTYCSPKVSMYLGYSPEAMIGKTFFDFMSDEEAQRVRSEFAALSQRKSQIKNLESWCLSREGRRVLFSTSAVPVLDEEEHLVGYRGVATDLTERKQAERDLENESARRRILFEQSPDGILIIDPQTKRFLDFNTAAHQQLGYAREEFAQLSIFDLEALETKDGINERVSGVVRDGNANFETLQRTRQGEIRHVHVTAQVIDILGQQCYHCTWRDITERKQAEERNRKLQGQLIQAQKMEAIGTLAGGIAHDFNNILGAILGFTEIARDTLDPESFTAQILDKVLGASHRAVTLVKQILAFSRQEEIERTPLQPAYIVKEALKLLRPSLPSTIAIIQEIDTATRPILADPTQVHQILINLCTNAFHAMEQTGGILAITLKDYELSQEDLKKHPEIQPGSFVMLSISDTGSGIDPNIGGKIFDPYFTTKEFGKGTGMGLAIVHGIVTSYGGFITSASNLEKGTIFRVFFPALAQVVASVGEHVETAPSGTERILLVDDEEMLAELGKTMLSRLGYEVTALTSSREALAVFGSRPDSFDVVITDQTMPGMTGMDLAGQMLQIRPDIPVILCTGYSSLISEEQAMAEGLQGFLEKPMTKNVIATLIRNVLDASRMAP